MSKAARIKGHQYEQKIVREFRSFGKPYQDTVSSRSESRNADDKGKDLMYTGNFCVQCKATEKSPGYPLLLKAMKEHYPKEIPLIFRKQNNKPETVTMLKSDFYTYFL